MKGTGEVVYVRTQGKAAQQRTEVLAAYAVKEFEKQLNNPVPEGSQLIVDMWEWDDKERSVVFAGNRQMTLRQYPQNTRLVMIM